MAPRLLHGILLVRIYGIDKLHTGCGFGSCEQVRASVQCIINIHFYLIANVINHLFIYTRQTTSNFVSLQL